MFSKLSIAFALLAASAQIVSAAPPACLLAAVNTERDPSDMATICGADASKVESQIKSLCGSSTNAAMSAFSDSCKAAGHAVAIATSASSSASSSAAHSVTAHKSGYAAPTPSFKSTATIVRVSGTGYSTLVTSTPMGTGSPYSAHNSTATVYTPTAPPVVSNTGAAPASTSTALTGGAGQTEFSMFALVVAGLVAMV